MSTHNSSEYNIHGSTHIILTHPYTGKQRTVLKSEANQLIEHWERVQRRVERTTGAPPTPRRNTYSGYALVPGKDIIDER